MQCPLPTFACIPLAFKKLPRRAKFWFFWVKYQYLALHIIDSGSILLPPINSLRWYDFRVIPLLPSINNLFLSILIWFLCSFCFYPSVVHFRIISVCQCHPIASILVSGIKFTHHSCFYTSIFLPNHSFQMLCASAGWNLPQYHLCHSDMLNTVDLMFFCCSYVLFFFLSSFVAAQPL